MTIIDRYIVRLFAKVLVICFLSLTGLFVVIDAFGNLEEFINYSSVKGSLLAVLCEYYGPRVLSFFDRTCGLLALIAAMFAITWLHRSNELMALMAAGVPKRRVTIPLVCVAVVVSLIGIVNRECLIPRYRLSLTRNAQDWLGDKAQQITPQVDNATEFLLGGQRSFADEQRIERPSFGMPLALGHVGTQLTAKNAYWRAATQERPAGYLMDDVGSPSEILTSRSLYAGGRPLVLTPLDAQWLKPNQCFVVSDLDFNELTTGEAVRQFSSSAQLIKGLNNHSLGYGADVRVTVHSRFVQPFLDMTLLMLGLPIVLSKQNRNFFVAAGSGLLLVTAFFLVVLACHALGNNYLISPATAAWGPLLVFAPVAAFCSRSIFE